MRPKKGPFPRGIRRFPGLQSFANRFKLSNIASSRGQTWVSESKGEAVVLARHGPAPKRRIRHAAGRPTTGSFLLTFRRKKNHGKSCCRRQETPHQVQLLATIATATELSKKQVAAVLDALSAEIQKSLSNKGAGAVTIPGLVKIEKKKVPARPAQKNVPNPFKPGELRDIAAKPASSKVKVRALKGLKDWAK